MGSWRKLLAAMVADHEPRSYTYQEAANVLKRLGFQGPAKTTGSHRRFRVEVEDSAVPGGKRGVIVGLVEHGSGPVKAVYIRQMVQTLRDNRLLPPDVEG